MNNECEIHIYNMFYSLNAHLNKAEKNQPRRTFVTYKQNERVVDFQVLYLINLLQDLV